MPHYVWETLCNIVHTKYQLPIMHNEENPGVDPSSLGGAPKGDSPTEETEEDKLEGAQETGGEGNGEDNP